MQGFYCLEQSVLLTGGGRVGEVGGVYLITDT